MADTRSTLPWAAVGLLASVNTLSFLDRMAVGVLGAPIRAAFHLSGAEFGVLSGVAFSAIYALASLPVARLADKWRADMVLAGSIVLWSVAAVCGGLAPTFGALVASRMALALGESGGAPVAYSIVAANVPSARRALATSIVILGAPVGSMLGARAIASVAQTYGWRGAMIGIGLIGLVAAPVLLFALGRMVPNPRGALGAAVSWQRVIAWFRDSRRLGLAIGYGAIVMVTVAGVQWLPQVFARAHALSLVSAASALGLAVGVGGIAGTLGGPLLIGALVGSEAGCCVRAAAWLIPIGSGALWLTLTLPETGPATAAMAVFFAAFTAVLPVIVARIPEIAPDDGKATANASTLLPGDLFGASAGPLLVGLVADFGARVAGANAAIWGLIFVGALALVGWPALRAAGRQPSWHSAAPLDTFSAHAT